MPMNLGMLNNGEKIRLTDSLVLTIRVYASGCTTDIFDGNDFIAGTALDTRDDCIAWAIRSLWERIDDYTAKTVALMGAVGKLRG